VTGKREKLKVKNDMKLTSFFDSHDVLLLDGATGSQLIARGLASGECPELWNITHKQEVREIAGLYFSAGADAVLTNTFGGSALKLKDYGLQDRVFELNFAGASNACEVRPAGRFVIGSMGPSGKMLEPFGDVSEEEVTGSFRKQAEALAKAGVDGFMLETFLDLRELICAIHAVKQTSDLPFITSLTYSLTPGGFFTIMGNGISEAIAELSGFGPLAMGSNCGNGIVNMIEVGRQLRQSHPEGIILLKPNAGEPVLKNGITCYSETPEDFESHFRELVSFKPLILGGCCGTGADHIRTFRNLIDATSV
jgi:5-methyltetrahydrofolate--homocysteine methyltransferase